MSDTAKRGVPVRFCFLTGGTKPQDVVSLAEFLDTAIEPFLTTEEELARSGRQIADDYDWEAAFAEVRAEEDSQTPESPEESDLLAESESPEQPAETTLDATDTEKPADDTAESTPADAPPSQPVREILVPIAPGVDPEQARQTLRSRLNGPLPAKTDLIMQTSGSQTGNGHLVAISASALVSSARSTLAALGGPGRWILALPTHHVAGLQVLTRSLISGTKPVIVDTTNGFKPASLVRAVERATKDSTLPVYLSLVPTQVSKILDEGGDAVEALAKVDTILVGGATFTTFLADRAKAVGWHVVETYGMTETCGGCVYDGIPLLGTQVSTVGDTVWITGTSLMEGYVEKPPSGVDPAEVSPWIQMGPRRWFKTSDTGRMEGPRLIIQGRTDDVINTGGVKVHASAVEQASLSVPGVGEVCVVGLPDARWGELVTAVVVPGDDLDVDLLAPMLGSPASLGVRGKDGNTEPDSLAARIRTAVTAELGAAHAPRVVVVVQHLPTLGPGKVARHEVTELAKRELRAGRAWVR
ncbi:MAG: AMP-binding protein [Mobiluncus sp.]|nr:AMP-binding protein [Mobiluncus sp.]MDY6076251.1 AMP-binding protein [Mobiluncus sp.]